MSSAPSPTQFVPVEHAVTTQMLWPMAPVSIAIIPEVESTRPLAMNVGATRFGPFSVEHLPVLEHQRLAAGARAEHHADVLAVARP